MRTAQQWREYLERAWGEMFGSPEEELLADLEGLERRVVEQRYELSEADQTVHLLEEQVAELTKQVAGMWRRLGIERQYIVELADQIKRAKDILDAF